MNGITRENAAKTAAEFFGINQYEYTGGCNDYLMWSAWDKNGKEWQFQQDISIAGSENEQCELVTPILRYEDIDELLGLLEVLKKTGAKSSAS